MGVIGVIVVNNNLDIDELVLMGGEDDVVFIFNMGFNFVDGYVFYDGIDVGEIVIVNMFNKVMLKDGMLDNGIIVYEWGYYISNCLVGNLLGFINF